MHKLLQFMKKVILDTSFILSCIRNKIDFFEEIELRGIQILIPKEVIAEIEGIYKSKKKLQFKEEAKLALKLLENSRFKKIILKDDNVDEGLIKAAEEDKEVIIATLDREIKEKIKNNKLVIRGKKKLEIV